MPALRQAGIVFETVPGSGGCRSPGENHSHGPAVVGRLALEARCLVVADGSVIVPQSPALIIIGSVARDRNEALACNTIHTIEPSIEAVR